MDGKLSILILETLKKKLENAKNISAEKYNEIITPYINSLNKNIDKQSLYAKIIKRKESLAQIYQMVYYIEKIAKKRNNNAKEI